MRRFNPSDNDYLMAKRQKAFRRAALLLSTAAYLLCRIFIAMSIVRMIQRIIRCQTCRLAVKSLLREGEIQMVRTKEQQTIEYKCIRGGLALQPGFSTME